MASMDLAESDLINSGHVNPCVHMLHLLKSINFEQGQEKRKGNQTQYDVRF